MRIARNADYRALRCYTVLVCYAHANTRADQPEHQPRQPREETMRHDSALHAMHRLLEAEDEARAGIPDHRDKPDDDEAGPDDEDDEDPSGEYDPDGYDRNGAFDGFQVTSDAEGGL